MMQVSRRRIYGIVILVLLVVLTTGALAQDATQARMRFVHVINGASAIDVYTDGQLSISNLEYGEISLYLNVPPGDHQVTVTQTGVTTTLWQQTVGVAPGSSQSLIASSIEALQFQQYQDDNAPLPLGKARFTAIQAIPDAGAVDVVLADGRPVVSGLQYGQVYGTLDLPALTYELAVVSSGDSVDSALVPPAAFPLDSGTSYSLLIYGSAARPQTKLLASAATPETAGGFVRLAHGVSGAPAVDVYLNDALVAPSMTFGDSTEYIGVPAGSYNVTVREAGGQNDLALTTLDVADGQYATALILSEGGGVTVTSYTDDMSVINAGESAFNIINTVPGESSVFLALQDGSGLTGDIPSGESSAGIVAPTEGGVRVSITEGEEVTDINVTLESLYGGVYYNSIVVQGEDGPLVMLLAPISLAVGIDSAPGDTTVAIAEATEVAVEPTAQPEITTSEAPVPGAAAPAPAQPTLPPAATATPALGGPTARVLLDPGANLQLRQHPNSEAFSLGLAPSGTVLLVNGREGAPETPEGQTPEPEATEWVDPVTQLESGEDLPLASTWLNVTYNTPDGGSITAWVNALYVSVTSADGLPLPLRALATVPGNRAGQAVNTAIQPPTERQFEVLATVGRLDEGVNLQIRRIPDEEGESLALIPTGTQLVFLGINEDRTWVFVRYQTEEGVVEGWANARFITGYSYQDQPVDFEGLQARNLLTIVSDDTRGEVGGVVAAPTLPTRDPLRNTVVAQVFVNEGANLHLRRNADAQSESLALIPNGTQLVVDGRDEAGDWLRTSYEGFDGWVSADYVELSFNDRPYEMGAVPIWSAPLTDEEIDATMTATFLPSPTFTPQPVRQVMEIAVDDVGLTRDPGGSGEGLPVLTRGTLVLFVATTSDGQFTLIETWNGDVQGWVPSYTVLFTGATH